MPREKLKVGINSSALLEFGGFLSLEEIQPDFVELSLADLRPDEWMVAVEKLKGFDISIHAPYQNSPVKETRIDLSNSVGIRMAKKIIELAEKVDAMLVVFHCGDASNSLSSLVKNLRKVERGDTPVVIENLYTDGVSRAGETPEEILSILENCRRAEANVDVGHAYIASLQRKRQGMVEEFFRELNGFVAHMHVHNNFGIWRRPYDEHNPLFRGLIDYGRLRSVMRKSGVRTAVLEVKNGSMDEIIQSLEFLRSF